MDDIKWYAVTKTGITLSEGVNNFPEDSDIKTLYLKRGNEYFGINGDLRFFKNSVMFDLNIGLQKITSWYQYKTQIVGLNVDTPEDDVIHKICIDTEDNKSKYSYKLCVTKTTQWIECKKDGEKKIVAL